MHCPRKKQELRVPQVRPSFEISQSPIQLRQVKAESTKSKLKIELHSVTLAQQVDQVILQDDIQRQMVNDNEMLQLILDQVEKHLLQNENISLTSRNIQDKWFIALCLKQNGIQNQTIQYCSQIIKFINLQDTCIRFCPIALIICFFTCLPIDTSSGSDQKSNQIMYLFANGLNYHNLIPTLTN